MNLKSLIAGLGNSEPTAADVDEATAAARDELAAAEAAAGEVAERRRVALVTAGDAELDELDADLAAAGRRLDRARAALTRLAELRDEAAERERVAALDQVHADGDRVREAGLTSLRRLEVLFAEAAEHLALLDAAKVLIVEANEKLRNAGDERRVAEPWVEISGAAGSSSPVHRARIPVVDHPVHMLWPASSGRSRLLDEARAQLARKS